MDFKNKFGFDWKNGGTEPSERLKENGFTGGYKPPAAVFNWFWSKVIKAITEMQEAVTTVEKSIPTKNSAFENDAKYITLEDIPDGVNVINSLESDLTTSALSAYQGKVLKGEVDSKADAGHTHAQGEVTGLSTALNGKVDKVSGKGLSTNDYTTAEKNKLAGIAAGANAYTHPTHTAKESGLYKVTVDNEGHVSETSEVIKDDITALGIPAQDTTYGNATAYTAGLMSATDKKKLDTIEAYAKSITVLNNLNSATYTGDALSANMGYVLNKKAGHIMEGETTRLEAEGEDIIAGTGAEIFNDYRQRWTGHVVMSEGNVATGDYSHAEGSRTTATGDYSHAEGNQTTANGFASHAEGNRTTANGSASHAAGSYTTANDFQFVAGKYNNPKTGLPNANDQTSTNAIFSIGYGTALTPANAFTIYADGKCKGASAFMSSGADFPEYYEWLDGNPDNEDRRGRFVTLDGDKIKLANSTDDYILGVISVRGGFIGNAASEDWQGKYLKDVFGETIMKDIEIPETTDEKTGEIIPAHTVKQLVVNPAYNPKQEYISREYRQEWSPVGLLGQIIVVDDGTCQVNGYCKPSTDGIATAADSGYRVMKRIDDSHIEVTIK